MPFRFLSRHRPIQAYLFFCCLGIEPGLDDVAGGRRLRLITELFEV
jgi:hypothetical protein